MSRFSEFEQGWRLAVTRQSMQVEYVPLAEWHDKAYPRNVNWLLDYFLKYSLLLFRSFNTSFQNMWLVHFASEGCFLSWEQQKQNGTDNHKNYEISPIFSHHYGDVIMSAMGSHTTGLAMVHSTVYSGTDQRKHQSSALLAFVREIHRWPVKSPHTGPVTQKMFPFDVVIM